MNKHPIATDVQVLMTQTRKQVAERLRVLFRSPLMTAALGPERARRLAELSGDESHLGRVSTEVREAIVEQRPENKLGRWTLWNVIDAIGCLGDCAPGRWPYFTDEKRRVSLRWALEEVESAESAVAAAMRLHPAATPGETHAG